MLCGCFFFFKQKTAYELRISDWSSDVCSSDLDALPVPVMVGKTILIASGSNGKFVSRLDLEVAGGAVKGHRYRLIPVFSDVIAPDPEVAGVIDRLRAPYEDELRSEEHTSELQSLMRTSYAVFCLKNKKKTTRQS